MVDRLAVVKLKKAILQAIVDADLIDRDNIFSNYQLSSDIDPQYESYTAYLADCLKNTSSDVLLEMAGYFDLDVPKIISKTPESTSYWSGSDFNVFISHASADKHKAHQLKNALVAYEIKSFVAHDDIEPSSHWQDEIHIALRTMDVLVAIITEEFVNRAWPNHEIGYAFGAEKLIIPLIVNCDPYGMLSKVQGEKVTGRKAPEIAEKILQVLVKNIKTEEKIISVLMKSLISTSGFKNIENIYNILKLSKKIPGNLLQEKYNKVFYLPKFGFDEKRAVEDLARKSNVKLAEPAKEFYDDIPF